MTSLKSFITGKPDRKLDLVVIRNCAAELVGIANSYINGSRHKTCAVEISKIRKRLLQEIYFADPLSEEGRQFERFVMAVWRAEKYLYVDFATYLIDIAEPMIWFGINNNEENGRGA